MRVKTFQLLSFLLFLGANSFSQISSDSLLLYYPFNGNANDESGAGFNGIVNGPDLSEDRFLQSNSAYTFDGINDYILVPDDSELKPDFPFSISLWFTVDELASITSILYASDETLGVYSGFYIGYNPQGSISAGYCNGQGQGPSSRKTKHSNTLIETDEWQHLIVCFNAIGDIDMYINCVEEVGYYSGTATSMVNLGENGVVGRSWGYHLNNYHNGKIDDIRLYNKTLSPDEITAVCEEVPCTGETYIDTVTVYLIDTLTVYNYISVTDTLIIDVNLVSVDEESFINTLKVYPNPTNDIVNISTGDFASMNSYKIKIINNLGEVIFENLCNQQFFQIDISSFGANGLYFIQIIDDTNEVIDTRKIVLQ